MTEQNMIPMEDALNSGFENSTREELLHYCKHMGIDTIDPNGPVQGLKDALFAAMGYAPQGATPQVKRDIPKSNVIPPVNLTPHGRWGGKRRRVLLPRPEGSTLARAEPFGWNGKATYWLPYDEPVAVPYPIYLNIIETKRPRKKIIATMNADGSKEMTTGWDHVSRPMTDMGDDAATAHLPASLTEWYQEKGQAFYRELGPRDLRTVAAKLDIPTQDMDRKNRPHEDLLGDVLIFLFGFADSDSQVA